MLDNEYFITFAKYKEKKNMSTITLSYDARNSSAKNLVNFLKTLDFVIVSDSDGYNDEFVKKIEKSKEEAKNGKAKTIKTEDLWK